MSSESNGPKQSRWFAVLAVIMLAIAGGAVYVAMSLRPITDALAPPAKTQPPAGPRPIGDYYPGRVVQALRAPDEWMRAVITDVKPEVSQAQVHYIGFDCGWDEYLPPSRLRYAEYMPPYWDPADPKNLHKAYSPKAYPGGREAMGIEPASIPQRAFIDEQPPRSVQAR